MDPNEPQDDRLGDQYGDLAGYEPKDAVNLLLGYQQQLASENQRLRQEQQPPEPEPEPEPGPSVDMEVVAGEDKEAAAKQLTDFTAATVDALVNQRLAEDKDKTFPQDRERAKQDAAARIAQMGGNFAEREEELDKYMMESNGVTKTSQINPMTWVNAFVYRQGQAALGGANPAQPYVERPSPSLREPSRSGQGYEMPEEQRSHKGWETVSNEKIPMEEWVALRDDINNVEDYERFLENQKELAARRGRR